MQIDKQQIIEFLQSRGEHDKATQAEQELPGQVDTNEHADLLGRFGINPAELLGGAGGGITDRLGL